MNVVERKVETRGRKAKQKTEVMFNPNDVKLFRGSDLSFSDSLFKPFKTNTELDIILSTEGGLMPGINLIIAGGPGSGKTTVVLDMMSKFTQQGLKCLYVSAEMDEIGHYKYCKRMPNFGCVQTLFLKEYQDNIKDVLEYVFSLGYDIIAIDSIAEVLEMYKSLYKTTEYAAESWYLKLQDRMKKGDNELSYNTSFINIQQVTKNNDHKGSNRLKHNVDAFSTIERSKDGLERSIHFEKNRDCDKDFKIFFSIYNGAVHYAFGGEE
jgi:DNA repair protein RadA/Sms